MVEYSYDAWGNCKIIKDTDNIATYNPYRYRGYYYDEETPAGEFAMSATVVRGIIAAATTAGVGA